MRRPSHAKITTLPKSVAPSIPAPINGKAMIPTPVIASSTARTGVISVASNAASTEKPRRVSSVVRHFSAPVRKSNATSV